MRGWVAALLLLLCLGGVIGLILWNKTKDSPSPSPVPPDGPGSGPPSKKYCDFKATGNNKDNFTISSSENIALFSQNDNTKFTYPNNEGKILDCKTNASGLTEYAPSGPTHLGYKIDNMNNNTNTTLLPSDGKTTINNDTCSWDPNSNICDVAICNLDDFYNVDISYKDKGVKQILTEAELNAFKERVSCKSGEKVGKCSPAPNSSGGNCDIDGKQNNKINCLGTCSDTTKYTKEDCETVSGIWTYNPDNTQCQYNILNEPLFKPESIPKQGNNYKMCNNPGDNVPLDIYFTPCSGNCYPNPNNENPGNIHEMPLSWTNHCMFTNHDPTKPFNTNMDTNNEDCNTSYFTGKVYHNFCNGKTVDCSDIQDNIESIIHSPSPSPIPPPCMGGGDTFDTYNSCESVSCDAHLSGDISKGYEYTSCGSGKIEKNTGSSPSPPISLPPASYCDPTSPSPGIVNYMKSKVNSDCCEIIQCDPNSCPSGLYNPIANDDSNPEMTKCLGSVCNISECCVLKTCSEYMDDGSKDCNPGYIRDTDNDSYYILPTCCNGMIQVTVTFSGGNSISSILTGFGILSNIQKNVYPSLILKKLLTNPNNNPGVKDIDANQLKSNQSLSFINNMTTFIEEPAPIIDQMDKLENTDITEQNRELKDNKEKTVDFYILINQHDNKGGVTRFNIQRAWDDINKIIQDKTYDTGKIEKIDVVINDCRTGNDEFCNVASTDTKILGSRTSHCCVKNTCDTLDDETKGYVKTNCSGANHFEPEKVLSSPSPVSQPEALSECCVKNDITAFIPPLPSGMPRTVDAVYGSYVKKTASNTKPLNLNSSIKFNWVAGGDGTKGHWAAEESANTALQKNYECLYPESPSPGSSPTPKMPVFGVDETTNEPYYYKLEGCEDTKNIFCKIPDSDTLANRQKRERLSIPVTDERYDSSIYNLTKTLGETTGSYISMYKTLEIENDEHPSLNPNYGGITCQQQQAGIATIEPCDEPYGYIKFSGCNTYLDDKLYQFYEREYTPKDCITFNSSQCKENQNICEYTTENKCKPRPFPINHDNDYGKSCSVYLEASDTFSDASWLKEGFANYNYKDNIGYGTIGNKGFSSRIINDDSSPSPSTREVSRRTNLCGYNFQSPPPTPTSTPPNQPSSESKEIQSDSMEYYHSRVLDSTWLCEDKSCKASRSVNIEFPQGGHNVTEFTSFFDGDPLVYTWEPSITNNPGGNWQGQHLYSDSILSPSPGPGPNGRKTLRFDDYRELQDGINDGNKESDPYSQGVKDRIDKFTKIQNRNSHVVKSPSPPSPPGSQQNDDYNDSPYPSDKMKYVHNNIKYHNNYATMCGDNKYLRFFDYDTMAEITSKDLEAIQMSLIKNYQKCTPCRYQRDEFPAGEADKKYSDFYNGEYNRLSSVEKKYINDHNFPKSDGSEFGHVFLSEATQNKDYNIHNYTVLSVDTRDMTNCSVSPVSPDTSSNKEINIDEYSTHFVPWWRDAAATDLKVNNFSTVSKLSSPTTIPICDLHKDRCEDKTNQSQCLNASSSLAWNDTPTTFNASMCEWSDGKCITNASWVNDQGMCGHPCLSRVDARPRECKFSDDCEIRDRYNFKEFEGTNSELKMYCDSDGRNPILYGTKGKGIQSRLDEGNSIPISKDEICKPGYILYDIGMSEKNSGNTPSSTQTPSQTPPPNSNTVYKCLKCDEINSYFDQGTSSLNASNTNLLQAYDHYVMNKKRPNTSTTLHDARINQYKLKGNWKETNGVCEKKPACTSVIWPSPATAISAKYNPHIVWDDDMINARVAYTQNPAVAAQQTKQTMGGDYENCVNNTEISNATFNINDTHTWADIWNNAGCKKVFNHMDTLLGLRTSSNDLTLTQQGLKLDCDSCSPPSPGSPPCMQWWSFANSTPIQIKVGGMIPHSEHKSYDVKNTSPNARMRDICPVYDGNDFVWDGKFSLDNKYYCSWKSLKGQTCYHTNDACVPPAKCLGDNKCHGTLQEGEKCNNKYDCDVVKIARRTGYHERDIVHDYYLPDCEDISLWGSPNYECGEGSPTHAPT